jgi:DNA-binding transcriptional LysR family regulator
MGCIVLLIEQLLRGAMQDLNDLYFFVKIVDAGGFAAAERALNIPKSKLSRRTARLEEKLGVRLITRSTRHFAVTEVGQRYYEHCRAMLVEAEAAQLAIDELRAEPCGTLRLSCPIGLLHFHISDMLADFMLLYPQIKVQLDATNRRVDVLGEGIDLAIRVRPAPLQDSDLAMRVLSDRGQCLVASPGLVQQQGMPVTPLELAKWPSLGRGTPQEQHAWFFTSPQGAEVQVNYQPRLITTDMVAVQTAALAGVGVAQLPLLMVGKYIDSGQLVRLLPQWEIKREIIHLVFPTRRGLLPSVRALIDYLVQRYAIFNED